MDEFNRDSYVFRLLTLIWSVYERDSIGVVSRVVSLKPNKGTSKIYRNPSGNVVDHSRRG